jgi:TspO/MBR family
MEIVVSRIVNPFHSPKKTLGALNADVVATLISSAGDVALVVDKSGVIRDVAIASEDLSKAGNKPGKHRHLFLANGVLNILWSVLFFRFKRPDRALVEDKEAQKKTPRFGASGTASEPEPPY